MFLNVAAQFSVLATAFCVEHSALASLLPSLPARGFHSFVGQLRQGFVPVKVPHWCTTQPIAKDLEVRCGVVLSKRVLLGWSGGLLQTQMGGSRFLGGLNNTARRIFEVAERCLWYG